MIASSVGYNGNKAQNNKQTAQGTDYQTELPLKPELFLPDGTASWDWNKVVENLNHNRLRLGLSKKEAGLCLWKLYKRYFEDLSDNQVIEFAYLLAKAKDREELLTPLGLSNISSTTGGNDNA